MYQLEMDDPVCRGSSFIDKKEKKNLMGTKWDHEIYYILYLEAVASLTTKRSLTKSEKKGMTIR